MPKFKKIILGVTMTIMLTGQFFMPIAIAQGPITVLGRAATKTQRIAAATERLAAAQVRLTAAQTAFFAYPPTLITPAEYASRQAEIFKAGEQVAIAATELQDANTAIQEDILDILEKVLFQSLKKKILDMVVDQIIGYIQGEGSPRFITDWQGFFGDIVQGAVGDLTQALGLGFLCAPFSLPVRLQIAANLAVPVDRFKAKFNCTLNQIVGNIENFYNDFRNGGWKAYDVAWEPQNNYYGAIWLAWNTQQLTIANRLVSAANEVISNAGYLGVRKCYDSGGNEVDSNYAYTGATGVKCTIVTPGKALGDLVGKAVGSDIDFIVSAEDLSSYVAAIANALINRVIREGVGLLGVTTPSAPQKVRATDITGAIYGSGNIPSGVQGTINQYQTSLDERSGREEIAPESPTSVKTITLQQLEASRAKRLEARDFYNQILNFEDDYISRLRALKACEDTKNPAKAAVTLNKINERIVIRDKAEDDSTLNEALLIQLADAISEIKTLTETQLSRRISDYVSLLGDIIEASLVRDKADAQFKTTQSTLPELISAAREELRQCVSGPTR